MLPEPLQQLQNIFEKFPGIGPRQASRFSFFMLKQKEENINKLIDALSKMKKDVSLCPECYLPKTNIVDCLICSDTKRNKSSVCIVQKESDAINMEQTKIFNGVYLILGENISPIGKNETPKLRVKNLVKRLKTEKKDNEIILALNNNREGNFTSLYIQEFFKKNLSEKKIKISQLGRGFSSGSELEYADDETIRNAYENRK